ncbi:MAG: hypothetical protein AAGF73_06050 [Actinomycetota bacterium]
MKQSTALPVVAGAAIGLIICGVALLLSFALNRATSPSSALAPAPATVAIGHAHLDGVAIAAP